MVMALGLSLPHQAGSTQGIIGKKAPSFELQDMNGNEVSTRDFKGKVVILDFWAVWCGPCQISLPFFQSLADKYASKGLEVVGLHVEDRIPPVEEVKQYLERRKVSYTNLVSTTKVDDKYLVYAMPTTYILDRKGRVAEAHVGFNPITAPEEIEQKVIALLERK
jgi:thiol-disulfide isomerase/thioredoxin